MPAPASHSRVLRFESFELDPRAGELRKGGARLRLQGQPLQLLAILLQNPGSLVTREELKAQLWPADTFVDFDHSLYNAVARIRETLGDSAETPRYVETLSRRGYRFIGHVEEIGTLAPQPSAPTLETHPEPARRSRSKTQLFFAVPLLTLCAFAFAIWLIPSASHHISASPVRIHSIAVLPLVNLSGDPSQNFFVDSMTDELITDLAHVSSLRVISRTSVMRYKDSKKSLPEIAQELGVDSILEGSVTRSGNRVRITAQLLHAPTDQHLWAQSYDRDLGDVLRLQSEVAETVAQQVQANLSPQQEALLRSAKSVNPEAYDAYLRGRSLVGASSSTIPELNAAKNYFEEAIRKDPGFAPSYVGLAESYVSLATFHRISPQAAYGPAEEAIHKALELDPGNGEAHDLLAQMRWRYDRDWEGADREFNSAIAVAPNYDCAHSDRSNLLSLLGQRTEALAELARSRELNPGSTFDATEPADFYLMRESRSLVEASKKATITEPNDWLEHFFLGAGYEGSGSPVDAITEYQKAIVLSGSNEDPTAALAHAYAAIGQRAKAESILRKLENKSKTEYVSPYLLATVYASLGDKERAFALLERAYQERSLDLTWAFKSDLRLDNLRSDPRFQSMLRRIGFPHESHSGS